MSQHVGGTQAQEDGGTGEVEESASKRRRISDDPDDAVAAVGADGAPADGPQPVNGDSVTATNGNVPPEAAFWNALEDSKDEVRANPRQSLSLRQSLSVQQSLSDRCTEQLAAWPHVSACPAVMGNSSP